ncbi:hypothetical protein AB6A23_01390 [Paenibacillus tarimensis]
MMENRTICFFPVVGYQADLMQKIAKELLINKIINKAIFLCPSFNSYNAINDEFNKILLPKEILSIKSKDNSKEHPSVIEFEKKKLYVEEKWGINKKRNLKINLENESLVYGFYWREFLQNENIVLMILWNGYLLPQQSLIYFINKSNVPIFFMENGYEPLSFVVDKKGINAHSSFKYGEVQYKSDKLDDYDLYRATGLRHPSKFFKLLFRYLQVQLSILLHFKYRKYFRYEFSPSVTSKIKQIALSLTQIHKRETLLEEKRFVFFPLQVITDSQLLINYNYSQENAIKKMAQIIDKLNEDQDEPVYLCIKDHPRQETTKYFEQIKKEIVSPYIVFIPRGNIDQLLNKCAAVVTINSSVGYEALKKGKEVLVLGEAIYTGPGLGKKIGSWEELEESLKSILYKGKIYADSYEISQFINQYQKYCILKHDPTAINKVVGRIVSILKER